MSRRRNDFLVLLRQVTYPQKGSQHQELSEYRNKLADRKQMIYIILSLLHMYIMCNVYVYIIDTGIVSFSMILHNVFSLYNPAL